MGLEDVLTDFRSKVGTEIHVSDWVKITQDMVDAFGKATGDMNRQRRTPRASSKLIPAAEIQHRRRQQHPSVPVAQVAEEGVVHIPGPAIDVGHARGDRGRQEPERGRTQQDQFKADPKR